MKNYAFISYSHEDIRRVRRFHKKIELFSIPRILRKSSRNLPKRVFPIFRDETDLAGTTLTPQIEDALKCSDYLIVVCTKHSSSSIWVKREIEAFLKDHSPDHIIPIFFDRKTKQAFNKGFPNMLSELDAARCNSVEYFFGGRKQALFQIVARLLGCYSPELFERFNRRQGYLLMLAIVLLPLLVIAPAIDLMWVYKDHYDIQKYCQDLSFSQEWPEPINPLNPVTRLFVKDYYECTYRNNRIVRIRHISPELAASALPGSFLLEADIMEFAYNNYWQSDARISRVVFRDGTGQVLFVKNHALDSNIVDLTLDLDNSDPYYLPPDIASIDQMESADYSCRIAQFYDDAGRICQIWFLSDTSSRQVCDSNGCYGLGYVYSDSGQLEAVHCLDLEGNVLKTYAAEE